MKKWSILFGAFMLLLSLNAHAQNKMIVAVTDPWPPFIDPQNPKEGLSMEIVRAAFESQGYQVKLEIVPWARAEDGVKEGTYDILPNTWLTEKRKAYLMYSDPYATNEVKFIKKKGDPFEFAGIPSLSGKTAGIVRGYGYGDAFMKADNFTREELPDTMTCLKMLVGGRVDLTLEDEIVAKALIAKEDSSILDKIAFTKNALSRNDLHVTVGLKNPRHKEIIEAFNKGLAVIKGNGVYQKIIESYGIK